MYVHKYKWHKHSKKETKRKEFQQNKRTNIAKVAKVANMAENSKQTHQQCGKWAQNHCYTLTQCIYNRCFFDVYVYYKYLQIITYMHTHTLAYLQKSNDAKVTKL